MTKIRDVKKSQEYMEQLVIDYEPHTKWEAANNRWLKWISKKLKGVEYSLDRKREKAKNAHKRKRHD